MQWNPSFVYIRTLFGLADEWNNMNTTLDRPAYTPKVQYQLKDLKLQVSNFASKEVNVILWVQNFAKLYAYEKLYVQGILTTIKSIYIYFVLCELRILVQSKQWKQRNHVWNLFKDSNKGTNQIDVFVSLKWLHPLFWCFHCCFEQVGWLRPFASINNCTSNISSMLIFHFDLH